MTTELEVYALRQMTPLECAERLIACSTGELLAVCSFLHLRVPRRATNSDLIAALIQHLHRLLQPPQVPALYTQHELFN